MKSILKNYRCILLALALLLVPSARSVAEDEPQKAVLNILSQLPPGTSAEYRILVTETGFSVDQLTTRCFCLADADPESTISLSLILNSVGSAGKHQENDTTYLRIENNWLSGEGESYLQENWVEEMMLTPDVSREDVLGGAFDSKILESLNRIFALKLVSVTGVEQRGSEECNISGLGVLKCKRELVKLLCDVGEHDQPVPALMMIWRHPEAPFGVAFLHYITYSTYSIYIQLIKFSVVSNWFHKNLTHMSNQELIEAALWLDTRLRRPDGVVPPTEQSDIADILIRIHKILNARIKAAPRDKRGLPMLKGIQWDRDDPLAGIVEGISPFQMIDWWHLVRQKPTTATTIKQRTIEKSRVRRRWPPVDTYLPPEEIPLHKVPPPARKDFIRDVIQVLEQRPKLEQRNRNICVLSRWTELLL